MASEKGFGTDGDQKLLHRSKPNRIEMIAAVLVTYVVYDKAPNSTSIEIMVRKSVREPEKAQITTRIATLRTSLDLINLWAGFFREPKVYLGSPALRSRVS